MVVAILGYRRYELGYIEYKVRLNIGYMINTRVHRKGYTVGTRFNDPEGTKDFWLLNPNVVKSNF